ncbi:hypothetical protein KKE99_04610 [Patescibacteria group bacterium]|nr:hypothetical protein [Patescibacteria group bacterium]
MQTIYLSNEDTVDIIAGKIKSSQEKEINLLVLSRTIPVLSVVNLKMFKKIAENLSKVISVSTADEAVKILVENSGISLRASKKKDGAAEAKAKYTANANSFIQKARSVDSIGWSKGPIDLSSHCHPPKKQAPDFLQESPPFRAEENIEENEKIKEAEEKVTKFQVPRASRNIFIGFIAMVIIAVGIAAYVLLPTAKIIITPKANPINTNFDFIIDKNIKELDIEEKKIPATVIVANIEKDGQFTATGKKQLTSNAVGVVTMYNEWSSIPQKLVENTRLSTADGKIFKTTKSITVPGFIRDETGSDVPGKIDAPIVASEPGPDYNIDASDFTIVVFKGTAKHTKIYAKSLAATSGGASGVTTVVSADDFKKAKDFLEEKARKDIISQLNDKKPSDLTMIDQAVSVKSGELVSPLSIDQPTNKFKASLKISAVAFLFNLNDVKAIAKSILKEINEEKKNFVLVDAGLDYGDALIIGSDTIKLSAQSHANAFNLVNESDMRAKIAGKSKEDMEEYVKNNYPDINKVSVTLWPFWVAKIPSIEKNISISLDIPRGE